MNEDIMWLEPTYTKRQTNGDIMVTAQAYRDGKKRLHITFYDNSYLKVTHHGSVQVGIDIKNMRIIIKDPYPNKAYKLTGAGKNKFVTIPFCDESFVGEYNLVLDDEVKGAWHTERVR